MGCASSSPASDDKEAVSNPAGLASTVSTAAATEDVPSTTPASTYTPDREYRFASGATGFLGQGSYGTVRVAFHVTTGEAVAIKIMPSQMFEGLAKELVVQGQLDHPHVVKLYGTQVDLDEERAFMVMEMCPGGELFDRIAECGKMDEKVAGRYMHQIAQGIAYCHSRNIYHRDLKPENILLDAEDNAKVADFGLSSVVREQQGRAVVTVDDEGSLSGTLSYAAPELLEFVMTGKGGWVPGKADVWALGVILYSMLSGARMPFNMAAASQCPRYAAFLKSGLGPLCAHHEFSCGALELLEAMLRPNPDERITIEGVLSSPWLSSHEAAAGVAGVAAKWSELIGDPAPPAPRHTLADGADSDAWSFRKDNVGQPGGVNELLVRSLGWVQLPKEKEKMVGDIASALDRLGVKYSIERGELSDVVWAGSDLPTGEGPYEEPPEVSTQAEAMLEQEDEERDGSPPVSPQGRNGRRYSTGQLTVRIRINHAHNEDGSRADHLSNLHLSRFSGDGTHAHAPCESPPPPPPSPPLPSPLLLLLPLPSRRFPVWPVST